MSHPTSRRDVLGAGLLAVAGGIVSRTALAADPAPAAKPAPGELSVETLGNLLTALGLKPQRTDSRYDFSFKSTQSGEDWELSMSIVLSNDAKTIWLMAWLDELPKDAADVPRSALLRLLSDNDKMGAGQFFAYVAANRRFVLQRVLDNRDLTSSFMRQVLVDLGKTVVNTYPHWNAGNWKAIGTTTEGAVPAGTTAPSSNNSSAASPSKTIKK